MNELEDIKLRALLHEIKLDSPSSNFSYNVMNRILKEESILEKIKSERILGKGFWIITILFVVLFIAVFVISNMGMATETQVPAILPQLRSGISSGYQTFFDKIGSAPLSIAGILIATSILLFIERFINSNVKVFSSTH